VKRVGATAVAGALLHMLQSVVTLPVQLTRRGDASVRPRSAMNTRAVGDGRHETASPASALAGGIFGNQCAANMSLNPRHLRSCVMPLPK
jgi:hypothetical protein